MVSGPESQPGNQLQGHHRAAVVAGVGSWLPARVVTNHDLSAELDTSDEWIRSRTGIAQRHVIDEGMATSDLAVEAGFRALKSAGASDVDAVVVATTTPDRPCPATAPDVAGRLGLGPVPAFDVAAVCSGFVYSLAVASGFIAAGIAERVLVIGADAYSTILDPQDRTTRAVFGDGAGAVVLRAGTADEEGALGPYDLGSDGVARRSDHDSRGRFPPALGPRAERRTGRPLLPDAGQAGLPQGRGPYVAVRAAGAGERGLESPTPSTMSSPTRRTSASSTPSPPSWRSRASGSSRRSSGWATPPPPRYRSRSPTRPPPALCGRGSACC